MLTQAAGNGDIEKIENLSKLGWDITQKGEHLALLFLDIRKKEEGEKWFGKMNRFIELYGLKEIEEALTNKVSLNLSKEAINILFVKQKEKREIRIKSFIKKIKEEEGREDSL